MVQLFEMTSSNCLMELQEFEKAVKHAACDLKLQPEESFVLKVVQLEELLYVRHSVFIGTFKWKALLCLHQKVQHDKGQM